MKNLLLIFILSLCYTNFSYQSLLLPNSTYDLVSGYSKYSISKKILFNEQIKKNVEFSLIMLPQDIQTTSIDYMHSLFNYYHYFSINIIDYGQFSDSESNSTFSAKDIISSVQLTYECFPVFEPDMELWSGYKTLNFKGPQQEQISIYLSSIL